MLKRTIVMEQKNRQKNKFSTKIYSNQDNDLISVENVPTQELLDRINIKSNGSSQLVNLEKQSSNGKILLTDEKTIGNTENSFLRTPNIARSTTVSTSTNGNLGTLPLNASNVTPSPRVMSGIENNPNSRHNRTVSRQSSRSRRKQAEVAAPIIQSLNNDYIANKIPQQLTNTSNNEVNSILPLISNINNTSTTVVTYSTATNNNPVLLKRSQLSQGQTQQQQIQQSNNNSFQNNSNNMLLNNTNNNLFSNLSIITEDYASSGVCSIKGLKPGNPNWTNQDNFIIFDYFESNKDISMYCVLDGHGENGHLVSRRCKEYLPIFLKNNNYDARKAFSAMQNDLLACDFDVRCSGATCVLILIINGKLIISNCGDSRAVLARRNQNGTSFLAHALTVDHKPDRADEKKRILQQGGHLGCRHVMMNQAGRGPVSVPVGPCRVWYQHRGETLGLAMSRSLGDSVVHRCGVSADPEVAEHVLDAQDGFILLATDGIWDVLDNQQAIQILTNYTAKATNWSAMEAASMLCKFSRSRWEKLSPMIDDITCIVIKVAGPQHR